MTDPVLTLVVTAHRESFLAEAMHSVAAQSIGGFDIVCCADDQAATEVMNVFERLRHLTAGRSFRTVAAPGGTAGRVRNVGFACARTPWVSYLDGDDVLHPDAIGEMTAAIWTGMADVVSTGMARIDSHGRWITEDESLTYRPPRWIYHIDPDEVGHPTFFNQFLGIRRSLWERYPFDETTNGEDIDFMLHQLLLGRFDKIPRILYGYRDTPASFSKRSYPGGELCTRRYRDGYYARLFAARYRPELAANFAPRDAP